MNKKNEMKFLKKLAKYFKNVPPEKIDQKESGIFIGYSDSCGCFGAHIAKMEDQINKTEMYYRGVPLYDYEDGEKIFRDNLSHKTLKLFLKKVRPKSEDDSQLFSTEDWSDHPYKVIARVIEDLEG